MIRDGRMPTPEEARGAAAERRRIEREKRAKRPSEQKRRTRRKAREEALRRAAEARWREQEAQPLYEVLAETFDFADSGLWKSNSFGRLKPRLIVHLEAAVADLEVGSVFTRGKARLERAKALLEVLKR
jgi:hypothetical protein